MANGKVTINDTPTKSKLFHFCEKKISKWLQMRLGEPIASLGEEAIFQVSFTKENGTQQVSCVTEISLRGSSWRGCDLASDPQNAFIHSLKRLHPH